MERDQEAVSNYVLSEFTEPEWDLFEEMKTFDELLKVITELG